MPSISLFAHLFSLVFLVWMTWQAFSLSQEKAFLLRYLRLHSSRGLFLIQSPVSFLALLGRLLGLSFSVKGSRYFLPRQKMRVDRVFDFLLSQKGLSLEYSVCSDGKNNARLKLRTSQTVEDFQSLESVFSDDLGIKVSILTIKSPEETFRTQQQGELF